MKKQTIMTFLLFLLLTNTVFAAEMKIEPVYGYERTFHEEPAPSRYITGTLIGVRSSYGTEDFAIEGEVNQSTAEKNSDAKDEKFITQSLLLGFRLTPLKSQYFNIFFRFGARAKKQESEVTVSEVTTKNTTGVVVDPYAGTGLGINIASLITLKASATLVYNQNAEADDRYDARYTLSAGFKFGNK
jgi:hypothetical protein